MKDVILNLHPGSHRFLLIPLFFLINAVAAQNFSQLQSGPVPAVEFPNQDTYTREAVYIHELINYVFHPEWNMQWERNFLKRNGVRFTTGSVATDELMVEGQMSLNVNLQNGWWFNSRGDWYEGWHQNTFRQVIYLGLERELTPRFSLFVMFHPRLRKELADMQAGISWMGMDRENFLNVALVLEDFTYDHKNKQGGESLTAPRGIQWFTRYKKHKFILYSEGKYGSGFERVFPDSLYSPEETGHSQRINYSDSKIYFQLSRNTLFILQFYRYCFTEGRTFYADDFNYDYQNAVNDLSLHYLHGLEGRHRFRFMCHGLWQDAGSDGYQAHHFQRLDVMPALFYEYHISRHMIEIGYMAALNNWDYQNLTGGEDYRREMGYYDKAYLGYTYAFNPTAQLQVSISHQPALSGFGGANARYIMHF